MYFKRWMAENYPDGLCFVRKTNIMEVEKSLVVRKRGHVGKGSPDQPRDERGRWTSGGGGSGNSGGSSSGGVDSPKKRLQKMIDDGDVTLELNETMQNRHYKGTNEYNSFLAIGVEKSYFTVSQSELQDFLYRNATKGEVYISSAGDAKERFNFGKVVAFDTMLQKETTWLTAIYSKKRTHFSPYSPMPEEE